MRSRTRLTTPPGEEPSAEPSAHAPTERYVAGFARPEEPRVPGRHRNRLVVLTVLVVVGAAGYVGWVAATEGQFQDPALSELDPDTEQTTAPGSPAP